HTVIAAGAELVFRQQFAVGVEFGQIGIGLALADLAGPDHAAGYAAADNDIAAGIDADGVGLVGRQGLDLLDPSLVAAGVIARDKGIVIAVGHRGGGEIGGGTAGDDHAAGRIQRQAIAIGAAAAAQQILPHHIAGGIIFGEIDVLAALIELAAEIARRGADH